MSTVSGSGGNDGMRQFLNQMLKEDTNQKTLQKTQDAEATDHTTSKMGEQESTRLAGELITQNKESESKKSSLKRDVATKTDIKKSDHTQAALKETMTVTVSESETLSTPHLPGETVANFAATFGNLGGGRGTNLVAIMAKVLLLQSQSSSEFWKTMWGEASQEMNEQIHMAPEIAHATEDQYNEQANISENQASMALGEGITNLIGAGLSLGMGAYMSAGEDAAKVGEETGAQLTDDAMSGAEETEETAADSLTEGAQSGLQSAEEVSQETVADTEEGIDEAKRGYFGLRRTKEMLARIKSAYGGGSPVMKAFAKGMEASMGMQMFVQTSTGFINYSYNLRIAKDQKLVGQWDAVSQELNITVQYFGEAFGRTDSIMQGQQQLINTVNEDVTQIAQSIESALAQGWSSAV